jgi:hypothetical protein
MTSCEPKSDRKKRKSTHVNEIPEVLVINDGNDEIQSLREIKAQTRVLSTDAATSTTLAANRNSNVTSPVTAHADALVTTVNSERKVASTQTSSAIDSTAQKCDTGNDNPVLLLPSTKSRWNVSANRFIASSTSMLLR